VLPEIDFLLKKFADGFKPFTFADTEYNAGFSTTSGLRLILIF